ncbi:hypothetical protein GJ744_007825 [Endocarpon pusillum]|uniref:Uncharacterized protein n=1 Tax=Endocarpon pusillum TaxID=364733 RepID=A0A8H7E7Z2_9EURO|nr:hypothetical protein GJ744_007825 [Endocarpon pusillum]
MGPARSRSSGGKEGGGRETETETETETGTGTGTGTETVRERTEKGVLAEGSRSKEGLWAIWTLEAKVAVAVVVAVARL